MFQLIKRKEFLVIAFLLAGLVFSLTVFRGILDARAEEWNLLRKKMDLEQKQTQEDVWTTAKPVIYLYPEKTTDISVALHYTGKLTCTYPPLGNGWRVTAQPDGTLINHADKKEYSYLFWEGESATRFDMSHGFVVAGKDTAAFILSLIN